MTHFLVEQLFFARAEWVRALNGVSEEDGNQHFGHMNSISWIVGHLAWHEQMYWLERRQGKVLIPALNTLFAFGAPMVTPSLSETLVHWRTITTAATPYLERLTDAEMHQPMLPAHPDKSLGTALLRVIYHYWFHIGEILAIRQMLGQTGLPEFVGRIDAQAPYRPH